MHDVNEDKYNNIAKFYDKMSLDIINNLKLSKLDPTEVAHESGLSSDKMLELLFDTEKGDYLAFREVNQSIKRLSKKKENDLKR